MPPPISSEPVAMRPARERGTGTLKRPILSLPAFASMPNPDFLAMRLELSYNAACAGPPGFSPRNLQTKDGQHVQIKQADDVFLEKLLGKSNQHLY